MYEILMFCFNSLFYFILFVGSRGDVPDHLKYISSGQHMETSIRNILVLHGCVAKISTI
jgi:hypothetical protein